MKFVVGVGCGPSNERLDLGGGSESRTGSRIFLKDIYIYSVKSLSIKSVLIARWQC